MRLLIYMLEFSISINAHTNSFGEEVDKFFPSRKFAIY